MQAHVELLSVQVDRWGWGVGVWEEGVLDLPLEVEERSDAPAVGWHVKLLLPFGDVSDDVGVGFGMGQSQVVRV